MMAPFLDPLPSSPYFRLLDYQKKLRLTTYPPDIPLILFIFFSRIAAGLSLISVFFSPSIQWTFIALGSMIAATLASIFHLKVPLRFLTMARNNKSYLVWEVRLAGTFAGALALQLFTGLGYGPGLQALFTWIPPVLALLFLVSTAWAYRLATHPAWSSPILPVYYIASGGLIGLILRSLDSAVPGTPYLYIGLLAVEIVLLLLYRNHLKQTSPTSLLSMASGRERWTFLSFLWSTLLLPGLLCLILIVRGETPVLNVVLTISALTGILLERVLFFRVERPIFFLSFIQNAEGGGAYWKRG